MPSTDEKLQEKNVPQARNKKRLIIPLVIILIGLILLGGALYLALNYPTVEFPDNLAQIAPPDTLAYAAFDARPLLAQAEDFKPLLQAWEESQTAAELKDGLTQKLSDLKIDFEEDLLPWIGPAAAVAALDLPGFGITDVTTPSLESPLPIPKAGISKPPTFLAILTSRSARKANSCLSALASRHGAQITEEAYKEETLLTITGGELPQTITCAAFGPLVLISNSPDQVKAAIDRWNEKGGGLAEAENYKMVSARLAHPPEKRLVSLFLSFRSLDASLKKSMLGKAMGFASGDAFKYIDAAAASVMLTPASLEIESVSWGKEQSQDPVRKQIAKLPPVGGRVFEFLPGDSSLALSLQSPASYWRIFKEATAQPSQGIPIDPFASSKAAIKEVTNLDLEVDLISWMTGEVALGVFGASLEFNPQANTMLPTEFALLIEGKDAETVKGKLATLRDALQILFNERISPFPAMWMPAPPGAAEYYVLSSPIAPVNFSLGQIGKIAFFASSPIAVEQILAAGEKADASLMQNAGFKAMQANLPKRPLFILFADPRPLAAAIPDWEGVELLNSIQALAASQELLPDGARSILHLRADFPALIKAIDTLSLGPEEAHHTATPEDACFFNIQQLGVAMLFFVDDHDGHFPKADNWVEELAPYVGDEAIFKCPEDSSDKKCSYAMNDALSGVKDEDVTNCDKVVLLFETAYPGDSPHGQAGQVAGPSRHPNGNYYGFADSHADIRAQPPNFTPTIEE